MKVILLFCLTAVGLAQRGGYGGNKFGAQRFGGRGAAGKFGATNRFDDKLAQIAAMCPDEADVCGVPAELPESPDFDALKAGFECLKAIDTTAVSEECAPVLERLQSRGGRKDRLSACAADKLTFCTDTIVVPPEEDDEVPVEDLKSIALVNEPLMSRMEGGSGCFEILVENIDSVSTECRTAIEEKQQKREEKLAAFIEALSSEEVVEACGDVAECVEDEDPKACFKEAKEDGDVTEECSDALRAALPGRGSRGRGGRGRRRSRRNRSGRRG